MELDNTQNSKKKMLIFIGIGAGLFLICIVAIVFVALNNSSEDTTETSSNPGSETATTGGEPESTESAEIGSDTNQDVSPTSNVPVEQQVIRTVGEENIYGSDVIEQAKLYVGEVTPQVQEELIEKLVTDSVILQGAAADGLITIPDELFNTPDKDYTQRLMLVKEARDAVEQQSNTLKGTIISVWYVNDFIGPLGYERSQELAREKIADVYADVINGDITVQQAGERLRNDESLADIDEAYRSNVVYEFEITDRDKNIYMSHAFSEALWDLEVGEVSKIYTLQNDILETGEVVDAIYAFGTVTEKTGDSSITSFEAWLEQKKLEYEN